jgi:hypothetical protein
MSLNAAMHRTDMYLALTESDHEMALGWEEMSFSVG